MIDSRDSDTEIHDEPKESDVNEDPADTVDMEFEVILPDSSEENNTEDTAIADEAIEIEVLPTAEEVEQLKAENARYEAERDQMLRTVAEYENMKRRAERDKDEFKKFALEQMVKDLIPTIDSIDRAIKSAQQAQDVEMLREGIQLIHKQLLDSLERRGVTPIEAVNEIFDPMFHEAVAHLESEDVPENKVIEEFQRGYSLHGRVLRPSMVSVSKGKPQVTDDTSETDTATLNNASDDDSTGREAATNG